MIWEIGKYSSQMFNSFTFVRQDASKAKRKSSTSLINPTAWQTLTDTFELRQNTGVLPMLNWKRPAGKLLDTNN